MGIFKAADVIYRCVLDGVRFVHEVDKELHEITWQPTPEGTYKPPVIGEVSQKDLKAIIKASKPASYVPPHARGDPAYAAAIVSVLVYAD